MVIPNACQVRIRWNLADGKIGVNVLYCSIAAGFQPTTTIAESIRAGLTSGATWTALAAFLATGVSLAGVDLKDVRAANLPYVSSTGASTPGTSASTAMPSEVAAVLSLRTDFTGPANRGRMFIPGWATNAIAAGDVIAAAAVTALSNWGENMRAVVLSGQSMGLSIGHPARAAYTGSSGTQHPARAAGLVTCRSIACRDNHWDTMRRRGLK